MAASPAEARILVVAGEASADEHAARVLVELRRLGVRARARGMGGPALAEAGLELDVDLRRVTSMGGLEVAARLPRIAAAWLRLARIAAATRPRAALLVDLPDFNLPLAALLRRGGVRILGYVAPQLWAWRPGRARVVAERYDRVACILAFEVPLLRRAGARATFVGHPLLDAPGVPRGRARQTLGVDEGASCLALLPGSRPGERSRLLAPMLEAAGRLRRRAALEVLLAAAPSLAPPRSLPPWVRLLSAREAGGAPGRLALAAADAALVASGTATVEAVLAGVPQVVAYRVAPSTYGLARLLVRTRFVAMPNLLLGRRVVPELIQGAATADAMALHAGRLLWSREAAEAQREAQGRCRILLGEPGAARRTAELLAELLA